jgi:hypothetical protein
VRDSGGAATLDPVLVASLYAAAETLDRATGDASAAQVAAANRDLRAARSELLASTGGTDTDDPFAAIDAHLRAAALGHPTH